MTDGYSPQLTVLAYIVDRSSSRVLMVHRIHRSDDEQYGKWNGLGGKVEEGEDIYTALVRELKEEASIEVRRASLRGTLSWPGFHADGTGVFAFVFIVDLWDGSIPESNEEGILAWQPIDRISQLDIWEGDRYFIDYLFDESIDLFHLSIPYKNYEPQGCSGTCIMKNGDVRLISNEPLKEME